MKRQHRLLTVSLVLAALVAPAVLDQDNFPLATYPMYARSRGDAVAVATVNGITSSGEFSRLSLQLIGESDDPLIVGALVRDAVRGGTPAVTALCRRVAARVAADGAEFDRIEVVTETHDVVSHTSDQPSLVSRDVHQTCDVTS